MSYDIKYRQRAIGYLSEGHSYRGTAEVFKVSPSTLQAWKSQLKETGTLLPQKRKGTWRKIDPEKLRAYVAEHPDAYQHEIAEAFGVRLFAIRKALKRLGITRKKTTLYKEIDESSRQVFVEKLKPIPLKPLYIWMNAVWINICIGNTHIRREGRRS
jgi:transposase